MNKGNKIVYLLPILKREYHRDAKRIVKILNNSILKSWKYKGISFYLIGAKELADRFIEVALKGETICIKK